MTKEHKKPIIGLTIGDYNGVGPEVMLHTLNDPRIIEFCTPVIFANGKLINQYKKILKGITLNFVDISSFKDIKLGKINVFNCWQEDVTIDIGQSTESGGKHAARSLDVAIQCLKDKDIDAIVTAPINKSTIQSNAFSYSGHTPYLKDKFEAKDVAMILFHDELRVSMMTEHLPLSEVSQKITKENLTQKINILIESLKRDFGIEHPSIAVLGLNPHNGDNGLYGKEEIDVIFPVVKEFREKEHLVVGPFSADSFFDRNLYKDFDLVLGMYHDQVLIPFKLMDQNRGVNYTAGLPIVRTSPDHGTAFDIAGKNQANPDSYQAALFASLDILRQRADYDFYTANPLKRKLTHRERD